MKFKVGQKWKNRKGEVFVIVGINKYSTYPISANIYKSKSKNNTDALWLYSSNGAFSIDGKLGDNMDLVELVEENEMTKEEYEEIREEEKVQSEPEAHEFIMSHISFDDTEDDDNKHFDEEEYKAKTFGFESSVAETLAQRGEVYGKFSAQLDCVTSIMSAMEKCAKDNVSYPYHQDEVDFKCLKTEWFYLAIKLARIASNPEHTDSYHDLAGYAMLLEKEHEYTN